MKAIVFDGKLKNVKDYPTPGPGKGEALIRVHCAGICNTDLEIIKGYLGFRGVMGHEFVGVIKKANGKAQHLVGKRVVGEINCGCGVCYYCLKGLQKHCPHRTTIGIAGKDCVFSEYVTLPAGNLWEVPDNVTDEEAVFIEPLAAAFEITKQVNIRPTDKILVLGDGKLGILSALVLNLTQAVVTLVGKHENKLRIAREQYINTVMLKKLEVAKQYDVVVEATGSAEGIDLALRLIKPRGTIILKTTVAQSRAMNLAPVVIDEVQVVGSRCGPFEPALRALSRRLINVKPLITAIYKVDESIEAFARAAQKESLKVIIAFRP